jgi:large subunit ribosomal protein L25
MELHLKVEPRATGKKAAKSLRREGKVPGIYYLHGEESIPVAVDARALRTITQTESSVIDLEFSDGRKTKCVVREVQRDPVRGELLHVDLMGIRLEEKVTVEVAVHIVGVPIGVKEKGGVLHQALRHLEIECLPLDIPEFIEVDVSGLDVHDSVHVSDIQLEGIKILTEPEQSIATVRPPKVHVEAVEAVVEEAEAEAEPEVVGREAESAESSGGEGS